MPTYDYVCDGCRHAFELFQSITEEAQKKCPKCKKQKLRRLFGTGAAIMFKGSGFYQTDYRSESYKKAASADSGASSDSGKGDSSKGDAGKGDAGKGSDSKSEKTSDGAASSGNDRSAKSEKPAGKTKAKDS